MSYFTDEEMKIILEIKKKSNERIKCLHDMIKHEENAQLYLNPILKKYCNHAWKDEGSFCVQNNNSEWRCSKCSLLKENT